MTMSNFINANINTSELSRKEEVSYRAQILSSEVGGGEGAPSFTITGSCDLLEASKQKPLAQRPRLPMPSQSLAKKVPEAFSEGLKVEHNYHDHANDPDGEYTGIDQVIHNGNGSGKCVEQPFPVKLHYMLNELEKDGGDNIVGWQPHGRCFVVRNQKLFVEQILGNWFRQQKYASFQRQLNIYGFKRITAGPDKGGYYNELFLRGKPGLAYRINRMKLKGTGVRQAASPETEPCLYNYSYLPRTNVAKTTRLVQSPPCATAASAGESISLRSLAPTLFSFSSAAFPSPDVGATTSIRNPVSSVSILQASQAFPYAKNPFRTSPMTEREILLANLVSTTSSGSSIPGAKDRNDLSNYLSPFF